MSNVIRKKLFIKSRLLIQSCNRLNGGLYNSIINRHSKKNAMKLFNILLLCCLLLVLHIPLTGSSQSLAINTDGSAAHSSAILDVKSTTKGLLIPRLTTVEKLAITTPAEGLKIYDFDTKNFWFYNGTIWKEIPDGSNSWNLSGNTLNNPANQFFGTLDDNPLLFRIKNINAGILDSTSQNTALGFRALDSAVFIPFQFNTAFGYKTLLNNTSGTFNTAIGGNSLRLNKTGFSNVAVGYACLFSNTTGAGNTANGLQALYNNTSAYGNTANGYQALYSNTTGSENTAGGYQALYYNTTGIYNTAVGTSAMYLKTTGSYNTAVGGYTLYYDSSGNYNTAVGYGSLFLNKNGSFNTALGDGSLYNNTTGYSNTAVGYAALNLNTTSFDNVAVGDSALLKSTGGFNTAVGTKSLANLFNGSRNIAVGYNSGNDPGSPNVVNTISIGNEGILNAANNQAFFGNLSTVWNGGNRTWSTYSDARMKNNIKEDVKGLDFIKRLKPVTYYRSVSAVAAITGNMQAEDFEGKYDIEKIKETGFLAQDVEQAAKAAGYDFSGVTVPKNNSQLYTLSYGQFVVPLVKAMQEQQLIIDSQQKIIEAQNNKMEQLEKRLSAIELKK